MYSERVEKVGCEGVRDLRAFSLWPLGTWQGRSRAEFHTEPPRTWSTTLPIYTGVRGQGL